MIKKISILLISLIIISCNNNIELKIEAEAIYKKGFKDLKALDTCTVEYIISNYGNVTGVNNLEKFIRTCPIDSIRNNYNTIKPIKKPPNKQALACFKPNIQNSCKNFFKELLSLLVNLKLLFKL